MTRVVFSPPFRSMVGGRREIELNYEGSLRDLVQRLGDQYGKRLPEHVMRDGELTPFVLVMVDEEDVRVVSGLDTWIRRGSQVHFLSAVAGGS